MVRVSLKCSYCRSINLVKHGLSKTYLQRYKCKDCGKTFQLTFEKKAYQQGIKEQIIEMSLNGSGTRDIARVLGVDKIRSQLR